MKKYLQEFPTGLPAETTVDGITESDGDSRYLKLDQTTPQTITGDTPKLDVLKSKSILGTDADGKIIEGTHEGVGEIDGGFSNSVYLVAQVADGGGA